MDLDTDMEDDDNEEVTLKSIQKLTGKLAQKLRAFQETEEGQDMTSKDSKYVINSILSAIDLDSMEEEDKEEIVDKIEGTEEEGMGDFNPDDMGDEELDFGGDDMGGEEPVAPEGEMGEGYDELDEESKYFGSFDDEEWTGDDNKKYGSDKFDFDFDEEEFDDVDSFRGKHPDMDWFEKGPRDSDFFNKYKEKHNSPLKVRTRKSLNHPDIDS